MEQLNESVDKVEWTDNSDSIRTSENPGAGDRGKSDETVNQNETAEDLPQNEYNDPLTFIQSQRKDIDFIKGLALREIGRAPRRLMQHKTFLINQGSRPIGFISYCRMERRYIYIYMIALEKDAQNKGVARKAVRWMIEEESTAGPVLGIIVLIKKTNMAALHATRGKYGYKVIEELPYHYALSRPVQKSEWRQ